MGRSVSIYPPLHLTFFPMKFIYKFLISIFFFILSVLWAHAWAGTDQYCLDWSLGYSWSHDPLFSISYNWGKLPVYNVFMISYGQRWVMEWTGMLFYWVDIGKSYEVYQYNCVTSKPKYIGKVAKNEGMDYVSWYAIYNEPYILYGTQYSEWPGSLRMTNMYIYNVRKQKLESSISHFTFPIDFYDWFPETVYKTKKWTFLISIIGDHSVWVRLVKILEIDPKTGKVTAL